MENWNNKKISIIFENGNESLIRYRLRLFEKKSWLSIIMEIMLSW